MFRMKNKTLDGIDGKKIKSNSGTYAVLILALGAMTFFGVCTPNQGPTGPRGPAAYIDSDEITFHEFRRAYSNAERYYRNQYGEDYNAATVRVAEKTLNELVNQRIMYQVATEIGLAATNEQVLKYFSEQEVFKDKDGNFSEEFFKRFLRQSGYTESSLVKDQKRQFAVEKFREFVTRSIYVSDFASELDYELRESKINVDFVKLTPSSVSFEPSAEEVKSFLEKQENLEKAQKKYESNKTRYSQEEQVRARHILISFNGARNASGDGAKRSKEDAKKLAEGIVLEVKAEGADFAEIAKSKTDEPSGKSTGGDLNYFTKDAMVPEFSKVAFALEKGSISDVVESPFGFHIIKVEDKKAAVNKTFDDVKNEIAEDFIKQEKTPELLKQRADEIQALALSADKKEQLDQKLKEYKLKWEATGDFSLTSRFIPKLGSQDAIRNGVFGLEKPGDLAAAPLAANDNYFIVKLKSRSKADLAKLDEDRKEQIAASSRFGIAYRLFGQLQSTLRGSYEKRNAIKLNPSYLLLDQPQNES